MIPNPTQFKRDVAREVHNTTQRKNLKHVTGLIRERRNAAFAAIEDGEGLREIGKAIKQESLSRLPELLEQLESNLTRKGIQVHWAETTDQANQIVLEICRRRGITQVIKGKSMVSEEMELNPFLAGHGIEAIEADLGEFIVQLAEKPPSHIIAPAIHLNKEQIAELFEEKLGEPYTVNIEEMTAMARRVLRGKFQSAGMGVTGVNFAIADTGTIALVENEGNGRMVTSVPPVHVALMGLEKVIAHIADLPPLIRLLCRSATGQSISTYFNWISYPRRPEEKDGPEEVHLVILDNGRSTIYADAELRETLDCIRCGACLNICPVYSRIGGYSYSSIYMGPIGKILTPQMAGLETAGHLTGASTLCGACVEVCPVKIPIPNLLLRLRQEANQPTAAGKEIVKGAGSKRSSGEAMVWAGWKVLHSRPAAYLALTRLAGLAGGLLPQRVGPLKQWSKFRKPPRLAKRTLHQLLKERPHS
ncbi:MAG: LutB/LldF family L-lactate oxidation iron-sulfur protein [SAR324 cluster bacterium]|nr:LutB/LldF family L-lactate oxidation iron-sulfur protein [SAR324 cluster bacterium]